MSHKLPLLFDLDGTLTNPAPGFFSSVRYALDKLKVPSPSEEVLRTYIGPPLRDTFIKILNTTDPTVIEEAVELYRFRLDNGGKFEAKIIPGIPAVLQRLYDLGHPLFVCTGKPEGVATEIVEHFELAPFFLKVYGAKLDGRHCDKAELIKHIWQQQALGSLKGIMIGDTIFDIQGAKANQLGAIAVRWGFGEDSQLLEAGADFLVSDTDELNDTLDLMIQRLE